MSDKIVHMLDYGAGNVRSVRNAIKSCGFSIVDVKEPQELKNVEKLIFPGVGNFVSAMEFLNSKGFAEPLRDYIKSGKHYFGICLGMQTLFEGSEEYPDVPGLGIIKGQVKKFDLKDLSVPQIGWNTLHLHKQSRLFNGKSWNMDNRVYFVHSYRAMEVKGENDEWILATTAYGDEFVSAVQQGNVMATQFHPEKSGTIGLDLFRGFLERSDDMGALPTEKQQTDTPLSNGLSKRIIACLDVRSNDDGDLVVTKGESYDVREAVEEHTTTEDGPPKKKGKVRNLGKPVALAARYFEEGADEVTFLNITSFRSEPLEDTPMLEVLEQASERVFVPLTIGGGIRNYTDKTGKSYSALEVAARYFRAGADKVSIASDAVYASEKLKQNNMVADGTTAIEQISRVYGTQAVVISIDPRRVYLESEEDIQQAKAKGHSVFTCEGKSYWYQCTVKGGREGRDLDALELAKCCEQLGAGELLLNSIDMDGQGKGFDIALVNAVCDATSLPVIASSGAGKVEHFSQVFEKTRAEAGLAAGIFHRKEVAIEDVKKHLVEKGIAVRRSE